MGAFALNYQRFKIPRKVDEMIWGARQEGAWLPTASGHFACPVWLQLKVSVTDHQTTHKPEVFFLKYTSIVLELTGNHGNSMAFWY